MLIKIIKCAGTLYGVGNDNLLATAVNCTHVVQVKSNQNFICLRSGKTAAHEGFVATRKKLKVDTELKLQHENSLC